MPGPNAGIIIASFPLGGGPYDNGQIKVVTNNAAYGIEWCPYQGSFPTTPIWRSSVTGPGNPGTFSPGPWMVKLRANQPVTFQVNPVAITVTAGNLTRVGVSF